MTIDLFSLFSCFRNNMYLKLGDNGPPFLASPTAKCELRLPVKPPKAAKGSSKKRKSIKAKGDEGEWITPNPKKKRNATKLKDGKKAKKTKAKKAEVIELLDESSSEEDEPVVRKQVGRVSYEASSESESENEF